MASLSFKLVITQKGFGGTNGLDFIIFHVMIRETRISVVVATIFT